VQLGECLLLTTYVPTWLEQDNVGDLMVATEHHEKTKSAEAVADADEEEVERRRLGEEEAHAAGEASGAADGGAGAEVAADGAAAGEAEGAAAGAGESAASGESSAAGEAEGAAEGSEAAGSAEESSEGAGEGSSEGASSAKEEKEQEEEKGGEHGHKLHTTHQSGSLRAAQCWGTKWVRPGNRSEHASLKPGDPMPLTYFVVGSTQKVEEGVCRRQQMTTVIEEQIVSVGLWLTVTTGLTSVVLLSALVCACVYQYHLVPRRERRNQSTRRTWLRMACPCVKPKLRKSGYRGKKGPRSSSGSSVGSGYMSNADSSNSDDSYGAG